MRALSFTNGLHLIDVSIPDIPSGEALIKVALSSICNTDLEICKGYMGFEGILGHEFVGIVEACASDVPLELSRRWIGKRVVGEINCGCGHCSLCCSGDTRHCAERTTLGIYRRNGTMAEYCTLPIKNLYEVPESLSDEDAVFTEPLAAAWEIVEQVHIDPNHRVLVLGDGKLGQLIGRVLRLSGCDLTVVGKHENKLRLLKAIGGIKVELLDKWCDNMNRKKELFDIVIEATGSANGLNMAIDSVRPRGIIVLKSTVNSRSTLDLSRLIVDEITVVGSRCGRFGPALRSLEKGLVEVNSLVEATYALGEGVVAFEKAKSGSLKVLVKNY